MNRTWGPLANQLHERHDASDFTLRTQDKLTTAESDNPLTFSDQLDQKS